jgi:hypothetical protein
LGVYSNASEGPESLVATPEPRVGSTEARVRCRDEEVEAHKAFAGGRSAFVGSTDVWVVTTEALVERLDEFVGGALLQDGDNHPTRRGAQGDRGFNRRERRLYRLETRADRRKSFEGSGLSSGQPTRSSRPPTQSSGRATRGLDPPANASSVSTKKRVQRLWSRDTRGELGGSRPREELTDGASRTGVRAPSVMLLDTLRSVAVLPDDVCDGAS